MVGFDSLGIAFAYLRLLMIFFEYKLDAIVTDAADSCTIELGVGRRVDAHAIVLSAIVAPVGVLN